MNVYLDSLKHVLEDTEQAKDGADWLDTIVFTCHSQSTVSKA